MKRLFLLAGIISGLHISLLCQPVSALQSEQNLITISVSDDYTDNSVEGIQVQLLRDGSELASGVSDDWILEIDPARVNASSNQNAKGPFSITVDKKN